MVSLCSVNYNLLKFLTFCSRMQHFLVKISLPFFQNLKIVLILLADIRNQLTLFRVERYLTGENLEVVWAKFSTLS